MLAIGGAYVGGLVADERTSDPILGCLVAADDPLGTTHSEDNGTYRIGPLAHDEFHGFGLDTDDEMARLGPFELVAGGTYIAPTLWLRKKEAASPTAE